MEERISAKKEIDTFIKCINKENNFYWILVETSDEIIKFKLFVES